MAVELYNEVEQSERVKRWIKEYGTSIVVGVALVFASIYGWRYWETYQGSQKQVSAEHYAVVQETVAAGDLEEAERQLGEMRGRHGGLTYTALAAMLVAGQYTEAGRLDDAATLYQEVLEQRRARTLHPIARLRLARVQLAQGEPETALATLDAATDITGFEAAYAEVRGDAHIIQGRVDEARLAYREALDNITENAGNPQMLELKLSSLGEAGSRS